MDDPERAVHEAVAIGDRLAEAGDVRRARAAYRRVIESGNPEWAPQAAIKLGDLFAAHGARSLALSSYKHAINAQSDEWSRQGWLKIRALLSPDGDRVDDHGDPTTLLTEALEQVTSLENLDLSARAAVTLGDLLREKGDDAGALAAYRQAAGFDTSEWSLRCWLKLIGIVFGDSTAPGRAARELLTMMETSLDDFSDEVVEDAYDNLNRLMDSLDDASLIKLSQHFPPRLANEFGDHLRKDGHVRAALAAYSQVTDSGDAAHTPKALVARGNLR
jgi:tetratricopeptide (TPR) repeat protein